MRRLYSTFAGGWPGIGLLLMRLVVGSALVTRASAALRGDPAAGSIPYWLLLAGCGVLLVPGLWTPVVGTVVSAIEIWQLLRIPADIWAPLSIATMAGALAMLGPGLWSVDARLFGWKRVEAPPRRNISHLD